MITQQELTRVKNEYEELKATYDRTAFGSLDDRLRAVLEANIAFAKYVRTLVAFNRQKRQQEQDCVQASSV